MLYIERQILHCKWRRCLNQKKKSWLNILTRGSLALRPELKCHSFNYCVTAQIDNVNFFTKVYVKPFTHLAGSIFGKRIIIQAILEEVLKAMSQWPSGKAFFRPRKIIWAIFVEIHTTRTHARYLSTCDCGLRNDFFLKLFIYFYLKSCDFSNRAPLCSRYTFS